MTRPNPKDYPFNYVIHDANWESNDPPHDCSTYIDAESLIDSYFDEYFIDDDWDDESIRYHLLETGGANNKTKIVWKSQEAAERFEHDRPEIWDEKYGDPPDAIRARVTSDAVAIIERRRDAFEAALEKWRESELFGDAGYQQSSDDEDEFGELCPFCGSSRIGGVGTGTQHCHKCKTTYDVDE